MGVKVREKKKGSGVWWVFVVHKGRGTSRKVGNQRTAEKVAEKLRMQLSLGDTGMLDKPEPEPVVPTFKQFSNHWVKDYIRPTRRPSTHDRYESILRMYVNPVVGNKQIDSIRRADVRNLILNYHKKGMASSSLCLIRDVVSGVFNYAMDEDHVKTNPASGVIRSLQISNNKKNHSEPFNKSEVDRILNTVRTYYPDYYLFFLCAFRTGVRMGELSGLRWGDVDWDNRKLKIQRSYKNGIVSATKTDKSRWVDISSMLLDELRASLTDKTNGGAAQGAAKGAIDAHSEQYIFSVNGKPPIRQGSIRAMWRRILIKSELEYQKFHSTRHTFASLLLSQGASPVYVKEQLGHSSIQITVDVYGHWIKMEENEKLVDVLDS